MNAPRARLVVACGFAVQAVLAAQSAPPASGGVILVDASGTQIAAPSESDPRPVVRLDPVRRQDVRMRAPLIADVSISGTVTDDLADIVPGHEADIKEVEISGQQRMPVVSVPVAPTATRPFAFRGRFSGVVSLELAGADRDLIVVSALNAVRRLGSGGVTLRFKTDIHRPTEVTTGSLHVLKGLGPFTMQIAPLRRDAPDTLVFFLGARVRPGEETRLIETGPDTRVFAGHSDQLGDVTLRLEDPFYTDDPAQDETIRIRLSSTYEIVIDEELALQETAPSSGIFRSRAGRLPNDAMLRVDYHPLDDTVVDVLRVQPGSYKAFFGVEPMGAVVSLRETSAASRVFEGQVPGLGTTRIMVEGVVGSVLHLTIDSTEADVNGYRMRLDSSGRGSYYIDADMPRERYTIPPTAPDSATLLDIESWEGPYPSRFFPFWAVAPGLHQVGSADYADVDGRHVELTTDPLPWRPAATPVRSKLPLVLLSRRSSIPGDVVRLRAPNVITADGRAHEIRLVVGNR